MTKQSKAEKLKLWISSNAYSINQLNIFVNRLEKVLSTLRWLHWKSASGLEIRISFERPKFRGTTDKRWGQGRILYTVSHRLLLGLHRGTALPDK